MIFYLSSMLSKLIQSASKHTVSVAKPTEGAHTGVHSCWHAEPEKSDGLMGAAYGPWATQQRLNVRHLYWQYITAAYYCRWDRTLTSLKYLYVGRINGSGTSRRILACGDDILPSLVSVQVTFGRGFCQYGKRFYSDRPCRTPFPVVSGSIRR